MYSDIQILCQGFYWNQNSIGQNYGNISFFNQGSYSAFTNEADLTPFIINDSLSPLSYEFEDSERGTDSSRLYFTPSDISFSVSDIDGQASFWVNGQTKTRLRDFFQILSDTTYIKYLVKLKYKGSTVFQGVVSNESLEEAISTKDDSHIIKVTVFGLEKEFKEYYGNKKLPDIEVWSQMPYQYELYYTSNNTSQFINPRYKTIDSLLNTIIGTTGSFNIAVDTSSLNLSAYSNWLVFKEPHLTTKQVVSGKTYYPYIRCGYDNAVALGETIWGFIVKLCNSMGWVFYIRTVQTGNTVTAYLTFKNRYTINKSSYVSVSDSNKLTPQNIGKNNFRQKYWGIYVPNGSFDSGGALNLYKYVHLFYVCNYRYLASSSSPFEYVTSWNYNSEKYNEVTILDEQGENEITIKKISPSTSATELITIIKNDILILDTGESKDYWRCDLTNGKNYADNGSKLNNLDIQFKGNYGAMMGFDYNNKLYHYEQYTSGRTPLNDIFRKNIATLLLGKSTQTTEVIIHSIETDPLKSVLINDEYYSNKYFGITEMTIDFIKDTTKFKLTQEL